MHVSSPHAWQRVQRKEQLLSEHAQPACSASHECVSKVKEVDVECVVAFEKAFGKAKLAVQDDSAMMRDMMGAKC